MKMRLIAIFAVLVGTLWAEGPRDAEWKKVEEARKKDQPRTQIKILLEIEKAALDDEAFAEAARALAMRIATEGKIEGKGTVIKKLDAELENSSKGLQPMLRALAAGWMHRYYQDHRWRFARRSSTGESAGDDLETWDLARILKEIDARLQVALADEEVLKATPVGQMEQLLTDGDLKDHWRPTMFDFVARQALTFYQSEEVAVSRPIDAFGFEATSPAFGTFDEFLNWKPESKDQDSPKLRALEMYQKLLAFHRKDEDQSAFLLADLERLRWASEAAEVDGREAQFEKALRSFIKDHEEHVISAWARVDLGQLLIGQGKNKEAHTVFSKGAADFGNHPFGKLCKNTVIWLERPILNISTENHWTPAGEEIHVSHRNLKRVWFRLYSVAFKPGKSLMQRDPLPEKDSWVPAMLKGKPVQAWSHELVDQGEFTERSASFQMPTDLPNGYHVLVSSGTEDFDLEDNNVSVRGIHITPLALIVDRTKAGGVEGFVVDAVTGEPLPGIKVDTWVQDNETVRQKSTKTNDQGYFNLQIGRGGRHLVVASKGFQRAVTRMWSRRSSNNPEKDDSRIVFFTDRSIYRPGQTVHFKGIWYNRNHSKGKYEVLKGKTGTVSLRDANRKEVASLKVTTNERGSFSGSLIAPAGSVLGRWQLRVDGAGRTYFSVEEYKRPKFVTEIEAPAAPAVLGKTVKVRIKAEAYTGAPVDGAKVSWRVSRTPRYPVWMRWCWWAPPINSKTEEIARGISRTTTDGSVEIEFIAKPNKSVDRELEPIFDFQVTADVTGTDGETRSATRMISVAYTSLRASLSVADWLEEDQELAFKVRTESLDQVGRKAKGILKIHQLQEPEECPRKTNARGVFSERNEKLVNRDRWELGEAVGEFAVETDDKGEATVKSRLSAGAYRLVFETEDAGGNKIKAFQGIQVVAPESDDFPTMVPFFTKLPEGSVQPGGEARVFWGSGHEEARACVEWYQNQQLLKREWSIKGRTQQLFSLPVEESYRGGISVVVFQVAMNRCDHSVQVIQVPWTNKELKLRWEHMVSKLEPGTKETWTAVVEGAGGEAAVAEMVATMYDASLDAFLPHRFQTLASMLRSEWGGRRSFIFSSEFRRLEGRAWFHSPQRYRGGPFFRGYRNELALYDGFSRSGYGLGGFGSVPRSRMTGMMNGTSQDSLAGALFESRDGDGAMPAPAAAPLAKADSIVTAGNRSGASAITRNQVDEILRNQPGPDLDQVTARRNLNETAFFFPMLTSGEDGKVRISFTMPEALTKWRFLGMAHDANFRSGLLTGETVTAKDLMVQPNPPRFLREGDVLEFTVKITNQSDQEKKGVGRLTLADAATDDDRTRALGVVPEQEFVVPAKQSRTLKWKMTVPDGAGFLKFKAVALSGDLSDGEEAWLPVLSRRILVTESMSLPIRNAGKKQFEFTKLLKSGESKTLEDRFVHVQVVSQPAWYAVMALPYLMEYPHECSEQTFNRYYANALARQIAKSDPKMRRIFDQWKVGGEALDSPLMKNADLKGILLDETPWLREATSEAEARKRVGLLFDDNQMNRELEKALLKLRRMQRPDGLWPWFPGGLGNEYITLYISTGFGRLRNMGVETDITPALRSLGQLDAALTRRYEALRKNKALEGDNLTSWVAHHLYTRTFFLKDKKISEKDRVAFDYFVKQAAKHWTSLRGRMSRAHVGLALHRLGQNKIAKLVTRSLKENAKITGEQGMFWKDAEGEGWNWWEAPIETQAMMIEAFREIDQDAKAVDDCQVWMIKQKQVGDWKTTKATADAVYALLGGGRNLLGSDALLKISLGGREVKAEKVEAGTGFYESRYVGEEVQPGLGKIELEKTDKGVSWASVHWQYLEDMAKVTRAKGKQLQLEKRLFIRKNTDEGPVLLPMKGKVQVGDEVVTRVILRNDRAMDFVHLKDLRGSGTEPLNVLSGYRWQDGFGYYEVTRDAASHFFIDRLPPGTHVFETSVRVQHAGVYQSGIAEVRCMYAPEFAAHSASVTIKAN